MATNGRLDKQDLINLLQAVQGSVFLFGPVRCFVEIKKILTQNGIEVTREDQPPKDFNRMYGGTGEIIVITTTDFIGFFIELNMSSLRLFEYRILQKILTTNSVFPFRHGSLQSTALVGKKVFLYGDGKSNNIGAEYIRLNCGDVTDDPEKAWAVIFTTTHCTMNEEAYIRLFELWNTKKVVFKSVKWLLELHAMYEGCQFSDLLSNKFGRATMFEGLSVFIPNFERLDLKTREELRSSVTRKFVDGCIVVVPPIDFDIAMHRYIIRYKGLVLLLNWLQTAIERKEYPPVDNFRYKLRQRADLLSDISLNGEVISFHPSVSNNVKTEITEAVIRLNGKICDNDPTIIVCPELIADDVPKGNVLTTLCMKSYVKGFYQHTCRYFCKPIKFRDELKDYHKIFDKKAGKLVLRKVVLRVGEYELDFLMSIAEKIGFTVVDTVEADVWMFVDNIDRTSDEANIPQHVYKTTYFENLFKFGCKTDIKFYSITSREIQEFSQTTSNAKQFAITLPQVVQAEMELTDSPASSNPVQKFPYEFCDDRCLLSLSSPATQAFTNEFLAFLYSFGVSLEMFQLKRQWPIHVDHLTTGQSMVVVAETPASIFGHSGLISAAGRYKSDVVGRDKYSLILHTLPKFFRKLGIAVQLGYTEDSENVVGIFSTKTGYENVEIGGIRYIADDSKLGWEIEILSSVIDCIQCKPTTLSVFRMPQVIIRCTQHSTLGCYCRDTYGKDIQEWTKVSHDWNPVLQMNDETRDDGVILKMSPSQIKAHYDNKSSTLRSLKEKDVQEFLGELDNLTLASMIKVPVICRSCSLGISLVKVKLVQPIPKCSICQKLDAVGIFKGWQAVSNASNRKPATIETDFTGLFKKVANAKGLKLPETDEEDDKFNESLETCSIQIGNFEVWFSSSLDSQILIDLEAAVDKNVYLICKENACFMGWLLENDSLSQKKCNKHNLPT